MNRRHPYASRLGSSACLLLVAVSGCIAVPVLEPASWTLVKQFRTAPNVDLFVHDFEGAASATIAHSLDKTYIVGWPTYVIVDETRQELASGIIWTREDSVRLLPRPPGLRRMDAPISTGDGLGGLHLVWGDSPDSLSTRPTELWYSHFDGIRWTEREKLSDIEVTFTSDKPAVMWDPGRSPLLRLTSGDLLFVTKTGHVSRELAHFRRSKRRWSKVLIPTSPIAGPSYIGLLEVAPAELVLAGIAAHGPPGETDHGSVMAARSADGGRTWSPFEMVHRSRDRGAHWTKLVKSPSRRDGPGQPPIFLVWHRALPGTDSILAARSLDGGRSWESLPGQPLPPRTRGIDAIARCDGSLEVASHTGSMDTTMFPTLTAYAWHPTTAGDEGGWRSVETRAPPINRWPRFLRRDVGPPVMLLGTARRRVGMPGSNPLALDSMMAVTAYAVRRGARAPCETASSQRLPDGIPALRLLNVGWRSISASGNGSDSSSAQLNE